ncbi:MAG: BBP7 family outer membrane beta-barrel protein [Gemmataceae bacterium]
MRNGILRGLAPWLKSAGWVLALLVLPSITWAQSLDLTQAEPTVPSPSTAGAGPRPPGPTTPPPMAPGYDPNAVPEVVMEGCDYFRDNSFAPRLASSPLRNGFGPFVTLPEDLYDNAACPAGEYPVATGPWVWGRVEYLYWALSRPRFEAPAPITSTRDNQFGLLDQPETTILYNGIPDGSTQHNGGRFSAGVWLSPNFLGLEASYFILEQVSSMGHFGSDAAGSPIIARPVINALTGRESALSVSFPGQFSGNILADAKVDMWGADANVIFNPFPGSVANIGFLVGVRYLKLRDELSYVQHTNVLGAGLAAFQGFPIGPPSQLRIADYFMTENRFEGVQGGLRLGHEWQRLYFYTTGKLAYGRTRQRLEINGNTTFFDPDQPLIAPVTTSGGLLALNSNIGQFTRDVNSIMGELTVTLGYRLSRGFSVYGGYNFMYWTKVMRASDQIDRVIDPRQLPSSLQFDATATATQPTPPFVNTDVWLQGIFAGAELRY